MKTKLIEIVGIGPTTAKQLVDSGIRTVTILADASIEKIAAIRGFATNRAELVISAAKRLLDESGVEKSPKIKENFNGF